MIHVIHRLVALTVNVEMLMVKVYVLAYPIIRVNHLIVNQNVLLARNVHKIEHVTNLNVPILVEALAA